MTSFTRFLTISVFVLGQGALYASLVPKALPDDEISEAITQQLSVDPGVKSNQINISSNEGIVTMDGTALSLLEKDRTEKIASTVRGVRAVINRIQVEPMIRGDEAIREDILRRLRRNPATDPEKIEVEVELGSVRLSGKVDSWQQKQLIETLVRGVVGIRQINNELSVRPPERRSGQQIKNEIEQILRWDVRVDHAEIDVEVVQGRVILSGAVGSLAEKDRAEASAWVRGVGSVDATALRVEEGNRDERFRRGKYVLVPDEDIRSAVRDSFRYDPRITPFSVNAKVQDGNVTLTGTVGTIAARNAAEEDAGHVVGVSQVDNQIEVTRLELETDADVTAEVEQLLAADPYLQRYDFAVETYAGEVHLRGEVTHSFEKNRAAELAGQVRGAVDIDNRIGIEKPVKNSQKELPAKPDWKIQEDIAYEFFWSPFVNEKAIKVSVDDGVATLVGIVSTRMERQAAEANAREAGAIQVINKIEIETAEPLNR